MGVRLLKVNLMCLRCRGEIDHIIVVVKKWGDFDITVYMAIISYDCSSAICNCDSNHICTAPYTCICPVGWTGDDCMEG